MILSAINTVLDALAPLVPPALGAAVGLRYTSACTPRDRAAGWILSVAIGIYLGPAIGEAFQLGAKTTVGIGFMLAMMGMEIASAAVAFIRRVASDPIATIRSIIDAIRGTK